MPTKPVVVILPGFTGTTLEAFPGGNRVIRWLSTVELVTNGPNNFQLAPDGVKPGPLARGANFPAGPVDAGVYEPLLTQLANDGWDARFYGYDWRMSINHNAPELVGYLEENVIDSPFWVVAHSQGALLARAAYHQMQVAGLAANWQRTVYLGGANGGSYNAAAALANLTPPASMLSLFMLGLTGGALGIGQWLRQRPIMLARWQTVVATWPGLYELLPSTSGPYAPLDPKAGFYFKQPTYQVWNAEVTQEQLNAAAATIAGFAALLSAPRPAEVCVLCRGFPTDSWPTAPSDVGADRGYTTTNEGDGVVPLDRQALPGADSITFDAQHQSIPGNGQVLARITDLLRNGNPAPATVTPPVLELPLKPNVFVVPINVPTDLAKQKQYTDP